MNYHAEIVTAENRENRENRKNKLLLQNVL